VIPDDAYLGLDPVHELDREQMHAVCSSELDVQWNRIIWLYRHRRTLSTT
jgi:hypothetical protein